MHSLTFSGPSLFDALRDIAELKPHPVFFNLNWTFEASTIFVIAQCRSY
jgi:hypothetical protein